MNTDEAFDLLRDAGVDEEAGINTVRRLLRERKITYEGNGNLKVGYIIDNTDQAFNLLHAAGLDETASTQIVRRWLSEGKIRNVGTGDHKTEYISKKGTAKAIPTDKEKAIHLLKAKIKAQDEHIDGLEKLHRNSINTLIQQREKLNKEIARLENDKSILEQESRNLLKENIQLRNELLKLKGNGNRKTATDKKQSEPPVPKTINYRQKLGLSKTASDKEVLAGYKNLLKATHPDHGGNALVFHYIKTEYDLFRKNIKE
ncbi:hypothetical protein [Neobacillus terrae]|uniref:hypothetical protein n=1 Tax=Neobacillus terrae TaxID=3034837 RepID=UPI001407F9CD|nr:hypothetical protein [Neobacillus terrae]NHM33085.1 hypothetical protein [Neobacillus terrae]